MNRLEALEREHDAVKELLSKPLSERTLYLEKLIEAHDSADLSE